MRASCVIVSGIPQGEGASRDQDDDFVLACAIDGEADYIVSGDPHLLDLKKYKGVLILSPREFVEQVLAKIS